MTKQVLLKAQRLVRDPRNWTTGVGAVDQDGKTVSAIDPRACKFCIAGAIARIVGYPDREIHRAGQGGNYLIPGWLDVTSDLKAQGLIAEANDIWKVNDTGGHFAALDYLDRLIAKAPDDIPTTTTEAL